MKLAILAVIVPLIGFVLGKEIQVPFLNSSGWTIHEVPPENRIYWMQQAMQALYNYSGPWYCPFRSNISPFPSLFWGVAYLLVSPDWPFGTVIVNHTASGDELVCVGANNITNTGGNCPFFLVVELSNSLRCNPTRRDKCNSALCQGPRWPRSQCYWNQSSLSSIITLYCILSP